MMWSAGSVDPWVILIFAWMGTMIVAYGFDVMKRAERRRHESR